MKAVEKRLAHLIEEDAARHLVEMGLIRSHGVLGIEVKVEFETRPPPAHCLDTYRAPAYYEKFPVARHATVKVEYPSHDARVMISAYMHDQPVVLPHNDKWWLVAEIDAPVYEWGDGLLTVYLLEVVR